MAKEAAERDRESTSSLPIRSRCTRRRRVQSDFILCVLQVTDLGRLFSEKFNARDGAASLEELQPLAAAEGDRTRMKPCGSSPGIDLAEVRKQCASTLASRPKVLVGTRSCKTPCGFSQ